MIINVQVVPNEEFSVLNYSVFRTQEPPMLPPSPAVTQGLVRPNSPVKQQQEQDRMETSDVVTTTPAAAVTTPAVTRPSVTRQSPGSSPDIEQESDFVLVPNSLAGDSSRNKNVHAG